MLTRIQVVAALVLLSLSGGGCRRMFHSWMNTPDSYVDGRWTGKMTAVELWDNRGTKYEAAGMEIETGPQLPYSHVGEHGEAVNRLAVLTDAETLIYDAGQFKIPPGRRVQVSGRMNRGMFHAPAGGRGADDEPSPPTARRRPHESSEPQPVEDLDRRAAENAEELTSFAVAA